MENSKNELDYAFIIPVWNEAPIIERTTRTLFIFLSERWPWKNKNWKIIIADNGSTDNTKKIADSLKKSLGNKIEYFFISERGRGNALKEVIQKFKARIYFYADADLPLETADITEFLKPIEENKADIVVGKREGGKRPLKRRLATFIMRFINFLIFELSLKDAQCGIKGWNAKAAKILEKQCAETGYFRDLEWLVKSRAASLRISEIPIHWIENRYADRKSKINLLADTLASLRAIKKIFYELYPASPKEINLFLITGLVLILLFLFQKILIELPNFLEYSLLPRHMQMWAAVNAFIMAIFLFLPWHAAKKISVNLPERFYVFVISAIFIITAVIAITTNPIYSQDVYWNLLLGKGFSQYHLNPYVTTPDTLARDPWSFTIPYWRNLAMTHGPLWSLLLFPVTAFTSSLGTALFILKTAALAALIGIFLAIFKIMDLHKFTPQRKVQIFLLLGLNPFVMENVLVDVHNDTFMVLFIVLSYLLLLKEKYVASALALIAAGLFKYAGFFLLPIPLFYLWRKSAKPFVKMTLCLLAAGTFILAAYLPFIFPLNNFLKTSMP